MKDSVDIADMKALHAALSNPSEQPRTLAVVAGAYLDDYLGKALRLRMPGLGTDEMKKLFDANAPLGTMGSKIELARVLNICDAVSKSDLITIARIRNRFAHNIHFTSFEDAEISKLVGKLKSGQEFLDTHKLNPDHAWTPKTNRNIFYWTVVNLSMSLHNHIVTIDHNLNEIDQMLSTSTDENLKAPLRLARSMFRTSSSAGKSGS